MGSDNDNFNEETIDGKNTSHVTTMVVYQRKPGETSGVGRRPATSSFVAKINMEWYHGSTNEFHKASSMDKVWSLMRMNLHTSSNQSSTLDERQIVPSWGGFHSVLFPHVERATTIGYCPLINGSSSEFSTIYSVMRNAQKMSASIGQQDAVITFDLAIYMKAKQIQWKASPEFENTVIRMRGFHIAVNFLFVIGKIYAESGLHPPC